MSEIFLELEGYENLEVSIIRATKIREVFKRILKLERIPNEEVFRFKPRSQTLLRNLNKLVRKRKLETAQRSKQVVMPKDGKVGNFKKVAG